MFSNNVVDSGVTHSEFVHIGDSAVATLGSTDRIFGTAPTFPNRILVANNHIREVGIYGKQVSPQCLSASVPLQVSAPSADLLLLPSDRGERDAARQPLLQRASRWHQLERRLRWKQQDRGESRLQHGAGDGGPVRLPARSHWARCYWLTQNCRLPAQWAVQQLGYDAQPFELPCAIRSLANPRVLHRQTASRT